MARKVAGASGATWDKEGELHGVFVESKSNVGRHRSNVYVIEKDNGDRVQVWGSTVLDTKFAEIPLESEVWIKCLGETTSKSGSTYVDYSVEYDDELPLAEKQDNSNLSAKEQVAAEEAFN